MVSISWVSQSCLTTKQLKLDSLLQEFQIPPQDGVTRGASGAHHIRHRGGSGAAAGGPAPPLPRHGQERGRRVRVLREVHVSEGGCVSLQAREGRQDHSV